MNIKDKVNDIFGVVLYICATIILIGFTIWIILNIYNDIIK